MRRQQVDVGSSLSTHERPGFLHQHCRLRPDARPYAKFVPALYRLSGVAFGDQDETIIAKVLCDHLDLSVQSTIKRARGPWHSHGGTGSGKAPPVLTHAEKDYLCHFPQTLTCVNGAASLKDYH
jgi:hypothetical protein